MLSRLFVNMTKLSQPGRIQQYRGLIKNTSSFQFSQEKLKVEDYIVQIVKETPNGEGKDVTTSSRFEDLGFDSLERVELIAQVEEYYDVTLDDNVTAKIITIQDAINAFKTFQ